MSELAGEAAEPPEHRRPVRSFVRRAGRLTTSQKRALDELWPRFGIEPEGRLDAEQLFGRRAPLTLEIGFGNGVSLAQMAEAEPEIDFIGIEVHRPGVGHLLLEIEQRGLTNVRVLCADAAQVLEQHVAPGSVDRLLLYFPDPWHKKRHHKRRIVQPAFARQVADCLRPGGVWHLATDWQDYAEHMRTVLENCPAFENLAGPGQFSARPTWRPLTKFEQRGQRLGHAVHDLLYRRRTA
ncbi:MAG: tRNA (guanosine(46)-N7)-methyltransferase TrmB [Halothiobacillaceae bacterium]